MYGVCLADLFTGHLTWRHLGVLVRQLPSDSALGREVLGDDAAWDLQAQLLAHTADLIALGNWQRGNAGRQRHSAKPTPIPRPGLVEVDQQPIGAAELRDWRSRHQAAIEARRKS